MSCILKRNTKGDIVEVLTPSGETSQLFNAIHENAFMGPTDTSARVLARAYQEDIREMFPQGSENTYSTGEPKLFYKSQDGTVYTDVEEMLIDGKSGTVTAGFMKPGTEDVIPVFTFSTNSGKMSRFVSDQILAGLLSPKRVLGKDGVTRFQGKGEYTDTKVATAIMLRNNLRNDMAIGSVMVNKEDGTIQFDRLNGYVIGVTKDGDTEFLSINEVSSKGGQYENQKELEVIQAVTEGKFRPARSGAPQPAPVDENTLIQSFTNFLGSLGFTTTTLDSYRKRFNTKFGKDPDINAISDVANRVVAFANGQMTEENMSEEVAHIALEAYSDQNSIVTVLATVHLTQEYKEFSDYYRGLYAPFLDGVELEDRVRKEILGKILAKELANKFRMQNRTAEEQNVISRLKAIWDTFINFIRQELRPYHIRAISELNSQIAESVLTGNLKNFEYDLSSSAAFFYSAMSQNHQAIHQALIRAKKTLEDTVKSTGKANIDQYQLDRISTDLTGMNLLSSVNTIVGIVDRKTSELDRELKNLQVVDGRRELLSRSGENIASSLREELIPLLGSIRNSLTTFVADSEVSDPKLKATMQDTIDLLLKSIDSLNQKNTELQPLVNTDKETHTMRIVEEVFDKDNMTPEQYQKEIDKINGTHKDYNIFGKLFGLMTESRNPVLQLIAYKVQQMHQAVRNTFIEQSTDTLNEVVSKGLGKYETKIIKRDKDGKATYYVWGPKDYAKYDKEFEEKRLEILNKLASKTITAADLKTKTPRELLGSSEDLYDQYRNKLKDWSDTKKVRQFKDAYYEDKKARFEQHKISVVTQEMMKNFSARAAEINRIHMNEDGMVDKNTMSPAEVDALNRIKKEKEMMKSPFDQANQVRLGLKVVKVSDLTQSELDSLTFTPDPNYKGDIVILADGQSRETLSEESRISLDMNTLAYAYMFDKDNQSKRTPSQKFLEQVRELQDKAERGEIPYKAVFDWVTDNSTLSLSEAYYSNLNDVVGYDSLVEMYIEDIEDQDERLQVEDNLAEYRRLSQMKRYLMKQNKKAGNTLAVNVHGMDEKVRLKLLEIEGQIADIRNRIDLPEEYKDEAKSTMSIEVSEDFYKMAKEAGLAGEGDLYTFALRHMTHTKKVQAEEFALQLDQMLFGKRGSMNSYYEEFLDEMFESRIVTDEMTKEQVSRIARDEFAKRNVASYYKMFTPENYTSLMELLESGEISMVEFFENREELNAQFPGIENVEILPDYTWTEDIDANDLINPDYKKGDYHLQLNDEYLDMDWFNHYGISVDEYRKSPDGDVTKLTATKNTEEFEFYKAYMNLRKKAIANYGDTGNVNPYLRVQISKTKFEDLTSGKSWSSPGAIKNAAEDWIKDFTSDRVDDKMYGEKLNGVDLMQEGSQVSIRAIPKYFQAKLDTADRISENSLSSVLLDLKESIVYAERQKAERDVRALTHQITKQSFIPSGASMLGKVITKPGQVSNMYEKAKEYIDHHLYGVQQSRAFHASVMGREVDLTKVLSSVQNFTRFSNLGFNIFVDLTGATTGFLNNVIDRFAGDYYHKSSVNRANSQATAMLPKYLGETGKIDRRSDLGRLFELMGIDNPDERVRESKAGRLKRILKDSGYLFSKLSNMAISPKIALATLNDHRFVGGDFIAYEQFFYRMRNENPQMTTADIDTKWAGLEKNSMFDHLDFTGSRITYTKAFAEKFENPEAKFDEIMAKISAKAQKVIMNSDMVLNDIDRVAAQRDVLANTLMMHRGWMVINLNRRFKGDFYNISTGRYEEGHYITLRNTLWEVLTAARKGSFQDIPGIMKGKDLYKKKNLSRVAIESGVLLALLLLGEAVLSGDDEDDIAIENLFQLIYLRTVSEYNSSTLMGIYGSVAEAASSPIPSLNTYKMLNPITSIPEMFSEDDEGNNKYWKKVVKNSPLRRYGQYSDLQVQIDAYRFYNDPTLLNLGSVGEKKDDDQPANENALNSIRIN